MKRLLFIFAGLLALASCQESTTLTSHEIMDVSLISSSTPNNRRSIEETQLLALNIASQIKSGGNLRGIPSLKVSSSYPLPQGSNGGLRTVVAPDSSLYVVQFANDQGYALVSTERLSSPVLYISDKGKFDQEFYDKNLKNYIQSYISSYSFPRGGICPFGCRNREECSIQNHPDVWRCPKGCTNYNTCTHKPDLPLTPIDNDKNKLTRWITVKEKRNLLKTNWSLWGPLSAKTPIVRWLDEYPNDGNKNPVWRDGQAFIGCCTVAIMQLLAYHKYPKSLGGYNIPWERYREMDDFKDQDLEIISSVAKYVADEIYSEYGYKDTRETTSNYNNMQRFLRRNNYKAPNMVDYNFELAKQELEQDRPIFIRGSVKGAEAGHMWLLDGYAEIKPENSTEDRDVLKLVHCNWGWSAESNNGYCLTGLFSNDHLYKLYLDYLVIPHSDSKKIYSESCLMALGVTPKI